MTNKELIKAVEAYKFVSSFSASELETLEILANNKIEITESLADSKAGKVSPITSIL